MKPRLNVFQDQLQRTIHLPTIPKKIISLVPSQTELLYHLGLEEEVIGITKFCVHPEKWYGAKKKIGGTKNLKLDVIEELKPDLIIANKEENTKEDIEYLASKFPVWISDVGNLKQAIEMIKSVGLLVDKEENANLICQAIKIHFADLKLKLNKKVAYVIWNEPLMLAGEDTFIGDMLRKMGLKNVLKDKSLRYPEISLEELKLLKPELIFLSSEPFPFKEKHKLDFAAQIPNSKVFLVDGEAFSWYGSHLLKSPHYFSDLASIIASGKA